jgi:protein-S-isoprenylcysteine O-methyltransferase Ste14
MNLALTRAEVAFRTRLQSPRPTVRRNLGELASKMVIVTLFSSMAMRLATDAARTGHVTGMLLVASEGLVVALTLVRRTAGTVDRSWGVRILTMCATFGPPLVRPVDVGGAPQSFTVAITAIGLIVVVLGKMSLGRSFGLTPANRGVVSTGMYRFVRHPIYLGYLITHIGFVLANPIDWNVAVLLIADAALLVRAGFEERTLMTDPAYREYLQRVRWRVLPGLY